MYVENSCESGMRISVVARWLKIRITLGFSKEKMVVRTNLPKVIVDGVHHVEFARPMDSIEQANLRKGSV